MASREAWSWVIQRSSPSGLSGWLSYAYGENRYEDRVTHEGFWGDLDQRHTRSTPTCSTASPHVSAPAQSTARVAIFRFPATTRGRRVVFRGHGPKRPATAGLWPPRPEGEPHVCVASPPAGAVRRVINVLDQDNVRFSPADQQPDAASDAAVRLAGAGGPFRRHPARILKAAHRKSLMPKTAAFRPTIGGF